MNILGVVMFILLRQASPRYDEESTPLVNEVINIISLIVTIGLTRMFDQPLQEQINSELLCKL